MSPGAGHPPYRGGPGGRRGLPRGPACARAPRRDGLHRWQRPRGGPARSPAGADRGDHRRGGLPPGDAVPRGHRGLRDRHAGDPPARSQLRGPGLGRRVSAAPLAGVGAGHRNPAYRTSCSRNWPAWVTSHAATAQPTLDCGTRTDREGASPPEAALRAASGPNARTTARRAGLSRAVAWLRAPGQHQTPRGAVPVKAGVSRDASVWYCWYA